MKGANLRINRKENMEREWDMIREELPRSKRKESKLYLWPKDEPLPAGYRIQTLNDGDYVRIATELELHPDVGT